MTSTQHLWETPGLAPGSFSDLKYRDDFWFDSVTGSITGPQKNTEHIVPSFGPGEVWALRIQVTMSSENTTDVVVCRLMDEEETDVLTRTVIDAYKGNQHEMAAIVTAEQADWQSGASSPDFQIEAIDTDDFNYFLTCRGVRLRRATDSDSRGDDIASTSPDATSETF